MLMNKWNWKKNSTQKFLYDAEYLIDKDTCSWFSSKSVGASNDTKVKYKSKGKLKPVLLRDNLKMSPLAIVDLVCKSAALLW